MERTNLFVVEGNRALWMLADNRARLYNEVNYERRQAYIRYKRFERYPKCLYRRYAPLVGSSRQIINKNNEASFLALKRLDAEGKPPPQIAKVSMPRYWKKNGKRELKIVFRGDRYRLEGCSLTLPKGLKLKVEGILKWPGNLGRLEIIYDDVDEVWRGFMSVNVEKPPMIGGKPLYIDLGVVNLATVWFEGLRQPIAYSGRVILADWWCWSGCISEERSRLARINKVKTSRRLRKLYRIRQRRFRHAVNAMVKAIVEEAYVLGISKIVVGDLKGIGENSHSSKANAMINNFWSLKYIVRRLKEKAEGCGIKVIEVSEHGTSSTCSRCRSKNTTTRGRLFKCLKCGLEAHRDVVGVLNMGILRNGGMPIGVVAHPLLLRWNGMRRELKRAVDTEPMKILEAESAEMMVESYMLQQWEDVKFN